VRQTAAMTVFELGALFHPAPQQNKVAFCMENGQHLDSIVYDPVADAIRERVQHEPPRIAMILWTAERKGGDSLRSPIDCVQESAHEAIIVLLRIECCDLGNIIECKRPKIDL